MKNIIIALMLTWSMLTYADIPLFQELHVPENNCSTFKKATTNEDNNHLNDLNSTCLSETKIDRHDIRSKTHQLKM